MLYRLDEVGRTNWTSKVRILLCLNGFGHAWINQGVGNEFCFINMLKQRLQDCAFQNWTSKLNDSSKADTYRGFKSLLNVERYLCIDMSLKLKQVLARFRCSSHKLQIEKGRHTGIDRSLRFCPLCQKDQISVVESEFHFLLECKSYQAIRDKYFMNHWRNGKNFGSIQSYHVKYWRFCNY